jgi:PPM family protein phosphatase
VSQFLKKLLGRSKTKEKDTEENKPVIRSPEESRLKGAEAETINHAETKEKAFTVNARNEKTQPLIPGDDDPQSTLRLSKDPSRESTAVDLVDAINPANGQVDPHGLFAAGDTSVGKQRDHNEDAFYMVTYAPKDDQAKFNFGLYIVADGMGGHQFGELASQSAINSVSKEVIEQIFDPMLSGKRIENDVELHQLLQNAYQNAHNSIRKDAPGGGTTVTTLLVLEDRMTIAHIGDSRAYHIAADGVCRVLTRDHSFVKKLIELGHITDQEAAVHPQRNVLYRALGQGESYEADIHTEPLPENGHLLICSDGLWGVVAERQIVQIVNSNSHPDKACKKLIESANVAGGPDNITAILVRLPS